MYDINKTGLISARELRSILTMTGEKLSSRDSELYSFFLKAIDFYIHFSVPVTLTGTAP